MTEKLYRCYRSTPQTSSRPKPTTQPGSKSSISSAGGRAPNTCPSNRSGGSTLVTLTLKGVPLCCNITTLNLAIVSFGVAATRLAAGVSPLLDDPNLSRLSSSGDLTTGDLTTGDLTTGYLTMSHLARPHEMSASTDSRD